MRTLEVILSLPPKRGPSIPKQKGEYFKTDDGLPALRVRWHTFFKWYVGTLVFQSQTTLVYPLGEEPAKSAYQFNRTSGLEAVGRAGLGVVSLIATGADLAIGAVKTVPGRLGGIGINYINDKGEAGVIELIGDVEVIAEIVASIPAERVRGGS